MLWSAPQPRSGGTKNLYSEFELRQRRYGEFWRVIAARSIITHEIETSRARIAIEELLKAQPNSIPWQAAEFLKFEPTFVTQN
jgi:hypothetical protein